MCSLLAADSKIILYIGLFDEWHGSSSRAVACLNGAVLVRSETWIAEGENRISTTVSTIRLNSRACGAFDENSSRE
jgi:hypothetical protein